jgi:hypothetical protein
MCTLPLPFPACYCQFRHQWHEVSLFVPAYTPSALGYKLIDSTCLSINTITTIDGKFPGMYINFAIIYRRLWEFILCFAQ